jgi:predicted  nucleic acid-binding Zn-ribbon protein
MLQNRLWVGLVAFAISFGISLVTSRLKDPLKDISGALLTGAITVPATLIACFAADLRNDAPAKARIETLKGHIRALQRRRMEIYEDLVAISAEKQQVETGLNSLQNQLRQLQIQSLNLWHQKEELSWDLNAPQPKGTAPEAQTIHLQSKIEELEKQERELNQSLSAIIAAKQRAEINLAPIKTELNQIQTELTEHRNSRDQLGLEVTNLAAQKQQLEQEANTLQTRVQELEQYRTELNQFLLAAEPKRQQVEAGAKSLHLAIQQLQTQVLSLHGELQQLETQIQDRRQQKESLEQELAALQGKKQPTIAPQAVVISSSTTPASVAPSTLIQSPTEQSTSAQAPLVQPQSATPELPLQPSALAQEKGAESSGNGSAQGHSGLSLPNFSKMGPFSRLTNSTIQQPAVEQPPVTKAAIAKPAFELPTEWTELMAQLPEYEAQALKAIAETNNPNPTLKKIAEANLTMPELLIDSINERALETIGDIIIESVEGSGAAIAQEHQRAVKKLIAAYEFF